MRAGENRAADGVDRDLLLTGGEVRAGRQPAQAGLETFDQCHMAPRGQRVRLEQGSHVIAVELCGEPLGIGNPQRDQDFGAGHPVRARRQHLELRRITRR